ncbi:NAD-dependent epimerase/dehydratase family protein [Propionibacterium freudenreichii]|uniref:NAD-dependent epimerase/dehydratase family protein n=1 Tax=Propionibacterium freudenreichii TaxID=1744 RepID=UPI000541FBFA|nr:NAD-dependent epimerase/dehydratase family protein [Propionibacterium freudenreichii]MCT2995071.1 NAD-dependent epimerase/dehydratase family protein [Propionibacterium freudenreichii]MCT3010989.1 NAD-dependent epimerase/dehydratase family protein [Propionibacterium freudenreichii]MDK9300036.1 NAD-dependent epimerase/dehydratase family protein [Propionibacterium freudenreichii]MDK9330983.1 NAD-dependent epimerase/dehydratase family protein [Propionibacterium freudenreichii]MDK9627237.1 NAD-d
MDTAWVIGSGGLLGGAVKARLRSDGLRVFTGRVHWTDPVRANHDLALQLETFTAGNPAPVIIWCAGAGVPSSPQAVFDVETAVFTSFLRKLRGLPIQQLATLRFFFASSAGAVYSGAGTPPYDEHSDTRPLAPYGHAKLAMESELSTFCNETGARSVCGRISNLYGPGQDLAKAQGLISVLLMSALTHKPVQIYVSFDTIRDYLFVDDAADLVIGCLERLANEEPGTTVTKVLCHGYGTTIGALLGLTRLVIGRRALTIQRASKLANVQTRDLSMWSRVWPELSAFARTPLLDGIGRTYLDLAARHNLHGAQLQQ